MFSLAVIDANGDLCISAGGKSGKIVGGCEALPQYAFISDFISIKLFHIINFLLFLVRGRGRFVLFSSDNKSTVHSFHSCRRAAECTRFILHTRKFSLLVFVLIQL